MHVIVKLVGALLILCTGTMLGCRKGEQYVIRMQLLQDMVVFLRYIQNNVRYRRDPTSVILQEAAKHCKLQRLHLALAIVDAPQLPSALQSALETLSKDIAGYVEPQELQQFARALLNLGEAGVEEETQKMDFTINTLQNAAQDAEKQAASQRKMYRAIGLSGGAAAALLFL